MPKVSSRVCSEHFICGTRTVENPDPVLKLGYDYNKPLKSKIPATHIESVSAKKKSKKTCESETSNLVTTLPSASLPNKSIPNEINNTPPDVSNNAEEVSSLDTNNPLISKASRPKHITHDHPYSYGWFDRYGQS